MIASILLLGLSLFSNNIYSNAETTLDDFNPCDFYVTGIEAFKDQCEEYWKEYNTNIRITLSDDEEEDNSSGSNDNGDLLRLLIFLAKIHANTVLINRICS